MALTPTSRITQLKVTRSISEGEVSASWRSPDGNGGVRFGPSDPDVTDATADVNILRDIIASSTGALTPDGDPTPVTFYYYPPEITSLDKLEQFGFYNPLSKASHGLVLGEMQRTGDRLKENTRDTPGATGITTHRSKVGMHIAGRTPDTDTMQFSLSEWKAYAIDASTVRIGALILHLNADAGDYAAARAAGTMQAFRALMAASLTSGDAIAPGAWTFAGNREFTWNVNGVPMAFTVDALAESWGSAQGKITFYSLILDLEPGSVYDRDGLTSWIRSQEATIASIVDGEFPRFKTDGRAEANTLLLGPNPATGQPDRRVELYVEGGQVYGRTPERDAPLGGGLGKTVLKLEPYDKTPSTAIDNDGGYAAGATEITVANASIFEAGDQVQFNPVGTGTEIKTVASISGNAITLTAGLTNAQADTVTVRRIAKATDPDYWMPSPMDVGVVHLPVGSASKRVRYPAIQNLVSPGIYRSQEIHNRAGAGSMLAIEGPDGDEIINLHLDERMTLEIGHSEDDGTAEIYGVDVPERRQRWTAGSIGNLNGSNYMTLGGLQWARPFPVPDLGGAIHSDVLSNHSDAFTNGSGAQQTGGKSLASFTYDELKALPQAILMGRGGRLDLSVSADLRNVGSSGTFDIDYTRLYRARPGATPTDPHVGAWLGEGHSYNNLLPNQRFPISVVYRDDILEDDVIIPMIVYLNTATASFNNLQLHDFERKLDLFQRVALSFGAGA